MENVKVFIPTYDHYTNIPDPNSLINPLIDVPSSLKEKDKMTEFYKLCNEYYSPEFGVKYLMNTELYPFQMAVLRAIIGHKFPLILMSRGGGKTFMLAVYALYHAIMFPDSKIVLISASFRQSQLIFAEIKKMYKRSAILRAISDTHPKTSVGYCEYAICGSTIKALPLGSGDKIRGERGHVILCDEFNSIPIETFDIVVRGFGATESNPWEKTRQSRKNIIDKLNQDNKKNNIPQDNDIADAIVAKGNRLVLSGTAGFKNETFYHLYKQYNKIIRSKVKGYVHEYQDVFKEDLLDDELEIDYSDYCIIKVPYSKLPVKRPGPMLDPKFINNARATMSKIFFDMEYNCIFADEGHGFFKMKDIKNATSSKGGFNIMMRCNKSSSRFIMGVDPARSLDRFAITLIELSNPLKLRYVWTAQGKPYSYSVSKMRQLIRNFNIAGIAMDSRGGGPAVEELLNKPDVVKDDDKLIFRFDCDDASADAMKILHVIVFSSDWIEEANVLLQKNIEDKTLMFPSQIYDGEYTEESDMVLSEVNDLKRELVSIDVTHTKTGKRHFDLAPPSHFDVDGPVKHKDRYSSLLLSNYIATKYDKLGHDKTKEVMEKLRDFHRCAGWIDSG